MMYQLLKLDDKEIVEMVFFPVINEACQVLSEGIANKASDLDIASIFGMGFPPYRCFLSLWKMQIRFNLSDNDWTLNSMYKLPDNNSWTLNNIVCFWQQQLNFENSDKLLNWLCNQGWHRVLGRFHRRKAHSRKAIRVGDEAWPVVQALLIPVRKGSRRCSSGENRLTSLLIPFSFFGHQQINSAKFRTCFPNAFVLKKNEFDLQSSTVKNNAKARMWVWSYCHHVFSSRDWWRTVIMKPQSEFQTSLAAVKCGAKRVRRLNNSIQCVLSKK